MAGLSEEVKKSRLLTGARAIFMIESVKVGYARNVSITEEIQYDPVEILDNIEVEEWVPIAYRVTLSASQFRIVGETLKSKGWLPSNGANTSEHLKNILESGELTCSLIDSKTTKIVALLEGVKIQSHNWTVDARGVVGEDITFVAIRVKDESEI